MKQKQLFSFLMFWDNPKHVDEKIVRAFKSDHEALKYGFDNRDYPGGRSIAWLADRLWKIIRVRIFERDNYTCQYCGSRGRKLECDHVIPVSIGGSNDDTNLVTSCKPCNRSKHAKTPDQWRKK